MKLEGFPQLAHFETPAMSEAWKYCLIPKLLPDVVRPSLSAPSSNAHIQIFGNELKIHSLPTGVSVDSTSAGLAADQWGELSAASGQSGLRISKDLTSPLVIEVHRQGDATQATLGKLTLIVSANVSAQILQRITGSDQGLTVLQTNLELEAGAKLDHAISIKEGSESLLVAKFESLLKKDATLTQTFLAQGGRHQRLEVKATLSEGGAHADLSSLAKLKGTSHIDVHSSLVHTAPNTTAKQLAKNFLDGESKAIFTGRVHIAKHAQQVAAEQMSRTLLLSKKAHAISQPQLEIFADDVKCAHGSTTGQIGEEASFYLLSRGIRPERAQVLLAQAFIQEVLHKSAQSAALNQDVL
ncbi:MAG: SufD family Fe-S cluster assembly protein [Bacteriovoracia bacterium]